MGKKDWLHELKTKKILWPKPERLAVFALQEHLSEEVLFLMHFFNVKVCFPRTRKAAGIMFNHFWNDDKESQSLVGNRQFGKIMGEYRHCLDSRITIETTWGKLIDLTQNLKLTPLISLRPNQAQKKLRANVNRIKIRKANKELSIPRGIDMIRLKISTLRFVAFCRWLERGKPQMLLQIIPRRDYPEYGLSPRRGARDRVSPRGRNHF